MKTVFLFLISICLIRVSYSQTLPEFAPVGAKWTYQVYDFTQSYTYSIVSKKKDTILGIECKQLNNYPGDPDSFYVYRDSLKIFFYHSGLGGWKLLYDFTKNISESYTTYYNSQGVIDSMIVSIIAKGDTLINGYSLPYIVIDVDLSSNYFFRGKAILNIGSETFFVPYPLWFDPHMVGLRCYEDIILGSYRILSPCDTSFDTKVSSPNVEITNIIVYQTAEKLFLNSIPKDVKEISVFDLLGRKIISKKTFDDGNDFSLDIRTAASGIYFYQITKENLETVTGKIIIQK